jgi:CRISPR-associated endonuclease/helicase Cas3
MKPKEILERLGPKSNIYEPIMLLRSLQEWKKYDNRKIKIPYEIRSLLEATYNEATENPKSWEKLFDERFIRNSNDRFKAALNSNYWQPQLPDEEGVQTRLNDVPTISLVLCKEFMDKQITFLDNTKADVGAEEFQLSIAQAIHKNIVKTPAYYFDVIEGFKAFSEYVRGTQTIGRVNDNGFVFVKGLKEGVSLYYSNTLGLVIIKPTAREDE